MGRSRRHSSVNMKNPITGYKIKHIESIDSYHRIGVFKGRELVGEFSFTEESSQLYPEGVYVNLPHRRQGLATAMYILAEKRFGKKVVPAKGNSAAAKKFWAQPNRPFGTESPQTENIGKAIQKTLSSPLGKKVTSRAKKIDPSFRWTCGGCFAFAEAMALAIDAELWVVAEWMPDDKDWASMHAFVNYKGKFYDATGEVTELKLRQYKLKKTSQTKLAPVKGWDDLWYPDQEFVNEEDIKSLAKKIKGLVSGQSRILA